MSYENVNDEDYSTTYDTVQTETVYEVPDQPAENEGPLYHNIHEDVSSENNEYATELEAHDYESVSAYAVGSEDNSLAFSQPEGEGHFPFLAICPPAPDPQPVEPQEYGNISVEELYSPVQDQEMTPEELQENRRVMEGNLPSPSSFTVQKSSEYSLTGYSAANGLEEDESASTNPEIFLFVKVRLPLTGTPALAGGIVSASFCSEWPGKDAWCQGPGISLCSQE